MWLGLDRAKILIKMLVTAGRTNHTFGLWLWIRRKKKFYLEKIILINFNALVGATWQHKEKKKVQKMKKKKKKKRRRKGHQLDETI